MLPDRFRAKFHVEKSTGCWVWHAAKCGGGYGAYRLDGRMRRAHRVAFQIVRGPVPMGLELDHLCRNRACVNPAHLEPVTSSENKLRSPLVRREQGRRGREAAKRKRLALTACRSGHEYTEENTHFQSSVVVARTIRFTATATPKPPPIPGAAEACALTTDQEPTP